MMVILPDPDIDCDLCLFGVVEPYNIKHSCKSFDYQIANQTKEAYGSLTLSSGLEVGEVANTVGNQYV
jgi:hypothetical protein